MNTTTEEGANAPSSFHASYNALGAVSNSKLTEIKHLFEPAGFALSEVPLAFGDLVDAMITETDRIDWHLKKWNNGPEVSPEDWALAMEMVRAFWRNEFCKNFQKLAKGQVTCVQYRNFEYGLFKFGFPCKCRYDLYSEVLHYGLDIKTTAATTQREFEKAIETFDYDRQAAWYMDISDSYQEMIVGISKKNCKLFLVPITRESRLYQQGKEKYTELAFRYWSLFG